MAGPGDAVVVAALLDDFNREFSAPTPGVDALTDRLETLLSDPSVLVVLAGDPPDGVAVVSMRPNVWHDGPVALLDELYVAPHRRNEGMGTDLLRRARQEALARGADLMEINVDAPDVHARRFYERHGFSCIEPTTGDIALYYYGSTGETAV